MPQREFIVFAFKQVLSDSGIQVEEISRKSQPYTNALEVDLKIAGIFNGKLFIDSDPRHFKIYKALKPDTDNELAPCIGGMRTMSAGVLYLSLCGDPSLLIQAGLDPEEEIKNVKVKLDTIEILFNRTFQKS